MLQERFGRVLQQILVKDPANIELFLALKAFLYLKPLQCIGSLVFENTSISHVSLLGASLYYVLWVFDHVPH